MRRAVQVCGGTLHTSRTDNGGGARAGSPVTVAHREPLHMFPHRSRPSRTCSRNAAACRAAAGIQGDGGCLHSLPRTHRRAVHMFPRRSGGQRRQCRGRKCSRPCGWSCGGRCGAECRRNWRQRPHTRLGTTADASARRGARAGGQRSRHRQRGNRGGDKSGRCPRTAQPSRASEARAMTSAARRAVAKMIRSPSSSRK